jgi:C-methyltransferase
METRDRLKSFFTDHWKYMAVSAACKLDLFDYFIGTPLSATELASKTGWDESKVEILLSALSSFDFLTKNDEKFGLSDVSEFLTTDHPESLKYAAMNWSGEHLTAWQQLDYTIRSGKSSFEHIFGRPFFQSLSENPLKEKEYQFAMKEYAHDDYKRLPELIDFGLHKRIMDVGGGSGIALQFIKDRFPKAECVLFDLEGVTKCCSYQSIVAISGDFFSEIPKGADALILSRVLHDWNDEKAAGILSNCWNAMASNATLYVIENGDPDPDIDLSLLSLNMAVMCQSKERTQNEYIHLCSEAGFQFERTVRLNTLQTILIFSKP